MSELTITAKPELTQAEREALFGFESDIWSVESMGFAWRGPQIHFVGSVDGAPVTHVGALRYEVAVDEGKLCLGGLKSVVTIPPARGNGYAAQVVRHATQYLREGGGLDFGLLFCRDALVDYYAALGWGEVEGEVLVEHPVQSTIPFPGHVMILSFGDRSWPTGTVDLQSQPW